MAKTKIYEDPRSTLGPTTPEIRAVLYPKFLELIAAGMPIGSAAMKIGVTRQIVYNWRKADPQFDSAWHDATQTAIERMEAEADRRGIEGVQKPVFYQGMEVGQITEYSDTLLIFRLKRLDPRYRDRVENNNVQLPGQLPQDVDLRNLSAEELALFEKLIMKAASGPAPPVDPEAIEGTAVTKATTEDAPADDSASTV